MIWLAHQPTPAASPSTIQATARWRGCSFGSRRRAVAATTTAPQVTATASPDDESWTKLRNTGGTAT